jgi:hypothetical protein
MKFPVIFQQTNASKRRRQKDRRSQQKVPRSFQRNRFQRKVSRKGSRKVQRVPQKVADGKRFRKKRVWKIEFHVSA